MKRLISTCALAAAFAVAAHAQDSTTKSKTQIKADDAKAITATGCLIPGLAPGSFALRGGIIARGEEVTTKSRTETDVDKDGATTKSKSRTEADGGRNRVSAGSVIVYDLSPRAGVDLSANVGQQVQLTAIMLDKGKGDADVKIKENTRVEPEHGKDSETKSETKLNVERGSGPRLTVLSVKSLGQSCS
jgi:hypothetical protein